MSDSMTEDNLIRGEIQKVLINIENDMKVLKDELFLLNNVIEEGANLSITTDLANDRLKVAAKEAGIDLSDLETDEDEENKDKNKNAENSQEDDHVSNSSTDASEKSSPNVDTLVSAAKKITEKVERVLKK